MYIFYTQRFSMHDLSEIPQMQVSPDKEYFLEEENNGDTPTTLKDVCGPHYQSARKWLKTFGILVKSSEKNLSYSTNPSALFRPERLISGQSDCYEQVSADNTIWVGKTVLIADCTLPTFLEKADILHEATGFLEVLIDEGCTVYLWTAAGAKPLTLQGLLSGEFRRLSPDLLPITEDAFRLFLREKHLTADTAILLDHENFQAMSHIVGLSLKYQADFEDALRDDPHEPAHPEPFPLLQPAPNLVSFKRILAMSDEALETFAFLLNTTEKPLHLLINETTEHLEPPAAERVRKFKKIFLYIDTIAARMWPDLATFIANLPSEHIIGFKQLYTSKLQCTISDVLVAQLVSALPYLEYLEIGFCLEKLSESLAALSLHNHQALRTLSFFHTEYCAAHHRTNSQQYYLTMQFFCDTFLVSLPAHLRFLRLPNWPFSYKSLQQHFQHRLVNLIHIEFADTEKPIKTDWAYQGNLHRPMEYYDLPEWPRDPTPILLPQPAGHARGWVKKFLQFQKPAEPLILPFAFTRVSGKVAESCDKSAEIVYDLQYMNPEKRLEQFAEEDINPYHKALIIICLSWSQDSSTLSTLQTHLQKYQHLPRANTYQVRFDFFNGFDPLSSKETANGMQPIENMILSVFSDAETLVFRNISLLKDQKTLAHATLTELLPQKGALASLLANFLQEQRRAGTGNVGRFNDKNDIYDANKERSLDYRNIFRFQGKKVEPVNYHIIKTKSAVTAMHPIGDYKKLASPAQMNQYEQQTKENSSLVCARFTHPLGSGESLTPGVERVALPNLFLSSRLTALYCSAEVIGIWYCAFRHQYFADIVVKTSPKEVVFQYGLELTAPETERVLTNRNTYSPEIQALPKLLVFAEGIVTATSLMDFLHACSEHKLYLEQIIDLIIHYVKRFQDESLNTQELDDNASNLDNLIFQQRRGACRHRANLAVKIFEALFNYTNAQAEYPNAHYTVTNTQSDIHSFLIINRIFYPPTPQPQPEIAPDAFEAPEAPVSADPTEVILESERVCLGGSSRPTLRKIRDLDELYADMRQILSGIDRPDHTRAPEAEEQANPFLKALSAECFQSEEDYSSWLAKECQKPAKSLLLIIDDWTKWPLLEKLSRRSCTARGNPFACISSFDEINFYQLPKSDTLDLNTLANPAQAQSRPYSALGRVMFEPAGHTGVLFVTVKQYDPAGLNPLFDHRRLLKGQEVPETVKRVAIINQHSFMQMGEDFRSRFGKIVRADCAFLRTQHQSPSLMDVDKRQESFYFGDWQASWSRFAGGFRFGAQGGQYQPGWLENVARRGINEIVLYNSPKNMPALTRLLEKLEAGLLITPFEEIETDLEISYKKDSPESVFTALQLGKQKPQRLDFVLHPQSFYCFLGEQTQITEQGDILTTSPYVLRYPQSDWQVLVTEPLSETQWTAFEMLAKEHQLRVSLYFLHAEDIPDAFEHTLDEHTTEYGLEHYNLATNITWQTPAAEIGFTPRPGFSKQIYIAPEETLACLAGSVQKRADQRFGFTPSELVWALQRGEPMHFYGDPSPELLTFFSGLLCTKPYVLVNGEPRFVLQTLHLQFSPAKAANITPNSSRARNAFPEKSLEAVLEQEAFFGIVHPQDSDPVAFAAEALARLPLKQYRQPQEVSTWLTQGGLLLVNTLSEAPAEMQLLVRKWDAHLGGDFFWGGRFYTINRRSHKLLFTDVQESALLDTLPHIPRFSWAPPALASTSPTQSLYQNNTQTFYADYLQRYMDKEDVAMFISHLQKPLSLHHAKKERGNFWEHCLAIMLAETKNPDFAEGVSASQRPMVVSLLLHLRLQEMLKSNPSAAQFARGLILEGPPGIGKTKVMFDLLAALGYENKLADHRILNANKPGYVSAPSDDIQTCRKAISLAIEHGFILIIDEINTLAREARYPDEWSIMQQLHFYLSGNVPHSGILLASQNPAEHFLGRNTLPFLRYCQKSVVPALCQQDFRYFLDKFPHRPAKLAKDMKRAFTRAKADKHYPPNLRFFMRVLEKTNCAKRGIEATVPTDENENHAKKPKID